MINITDLLSLIIPLIMGILLGYALREKLHIKLSKVTFGIIMILIFSLGFSIGSNKALLSEMPRVGVNAVVILCLTLLFSVFFVKIGVKMAKIR